MASKQPRKQRKRLYEAKLHKRQKLVSAHLCLELREKYKKRSLAVRKGDRIKIMRGDFKGTVGKVDEVDLKRMTVSIEGITQTRVDGTKVKLPIIPSNLLLLELNMDDARRRKILERAGGSGSSKGKETKEAAKKK